MANTTTLADIGAEALDLADVTGSPNIDPNRLTGWVNKELGELHDLLVGVDQEYFRKIWPIPLAAGVELYDLPDDTLKIKKVYFVDSSGRRSPMRRFGSNEVDCIDGPEDLDGIGIEYDICGTQIMVAPKPSSAIGSMQLWYIPQLVKLANPGDTVNLVLPNGWEDFAIYGVAVRCLLKEESDISQMKALKDEVRARIIASSANRDAGETYAMTDYYARARRRWR